MAFNPNTANGELIDEILFEEFVTAINAVTPGAWAALALSGTWVNFAAGYQAAEIRRVGDEVQLRGIVKNGAAVPGTIATLPVGSRPPANIQFAAVSGNTYGFITVNSGGTVVASVGVVGGFDLSAIRFSTVA